MAALTIATDPAQSVYLIFWWVFFFFFVNPTGIC